MYKISIVLRVSLSVMVSASMKLILVVRMESAGNDLARNGEKSKNDMQLKTLACKDLGRETGDVGNSCGRKVR